MKPSHIKTSLLSETLKESLATADQYNNYFVNVGKKMAKKISSVSNVDAITNTSGNIKFTVVCPSASIYLTSITVFRRK